MEKFHNLPLEKQNAIINAGLEAFGSNGYKKTSVNDIATAAGISKAMVFHYFGTKKDFYFYLLDYCINLILGEISDKFDKDISDFFERIIMASNIKLAVIKKHPATMTFLKGVYYETNEEVKEGIFSILSQSDALKNKIAFEGIDNSKFKEGVDVKVVMKMLMWMSEGFVNTSKSFQLADLDSLFHEFYESMNLLKNSLYKDEYL